MREGTLLLVVSDHGMTEDGNHGGATSSETDTLIYGYLKSERRRFLQPRDLGEFSDLFVSRGSSYQVDQIDIVPTLAYLLGVSVPYNNLGQVIAQMILVEDGPVEA